MPLKGGILKIVHLKQQARRNLANELELEETICRQMVHFPLAIRK